MDSTVFVPVLYDGVWAVEGFNWVFNSPTSKTLMFDIDTTLEKLREVLYEELDVDPLVYELKLEVCCMYMKGTKCLSNEKKVQIKSYKFKIAHISFNIVQIRSLLHVFNSAVEGPPLIFRPVIKLNSDLPNLASVLPT
ncbi:uncharacterized protein LOC133793794 [Humulus lupulus]|uniref:uncharacterized protein LOC133793794 n=1 Tax=Humulus lupulus TaxID=3486 RepID=UPI002B41388E|nr:uncharacterized protein LOC133793794 [Humulus lupulus]